MGEALDLNHIKFILRKEVEKQLTHCQHYDLERNKWTEEGIERSKNWTDERRVKLLNQLSEDIKAYKQQIESKIEGILHDLDVDYQKKSILFKTLRNGFIDINLMRLDWIDTLINEPETDLDKFREDAEKRLKLEIYENQKTESTTSPRKTELEQIPTIIPAKTEQEPTIENKTSFSVIFKKYYEWKKTEGVRTGTLDEMKSYVDEFIEITCNVSLNDLSKDDVRKYMNIQQKLPAQRKKNPKYRNLSIEQLLKTPDINPQSIVNINKKVGLLSQVCNWAMKQGMISSNQFQGMKFSTKHVEPVKRMPFTNEELRIILKPETYLKWTLSFKKSKTQKFTNFRVPYYFCFLIGIFSGMRTEEITQLRINDVRKEKDIWFFYVEKSNETRVKTKNSIRKIPVHPQLIELGLIEYHKEQKKLNKDRLFWQLTKVRNSYSKELSRHFNSRFLPELGIWKKNSKVLYCTRHTFVNSLYKQGVNENVIKQLVGHDPEFTIKHYGGEPFSDTLLLEAVSEVNYPGINWEKLNYHKHEGKVYLT